VRQPVEEVVCEEWKREGGEDFIETLDNVVRQDEADDDAQTRQQTIDRRLEPLSDNIWDLGR
jgi:hypothetical protein